MTSNPQTDEEYDDAFKRIIIGDSVNVILDAVTTGAITVARKAAESDGHGEYTEVEELLLTAGSMAGFTWQLEQARAQNVLAEFIALQILLMNPNPEA